MTLHVGPFVIDALVGCGTAAVIEHLGVVIELLQAVDGGRSQGGVPLLDHFAQLGLGAKVTVLYGLFDGQHGRRILEEDAIACRCDGR